ncbi:serine-rich adhesin for platelets-like isoform X2 [Littorina saxatilis]|uniref:serine-rich adhesin for platelets-like isoform X2 n=1 Tax=Littorina saxatilis TaxID=31220 RepID=UPI0038B4C9B1
MSRNNRLLYAEHHTDLSGTLLLEWLPTIDLAGLLHKLQGISPPALKTPGTHRFLSRPLPRSPLVTLMDDRPPQLTSTTKQTSIVDFFNPPRLKPLPLPDSAESAVSFRSEGLDSAKHTTEHGAAHHNSHAIHSHWEKAMHTPERREATLAAVNQVEGYVVSPLKSTVHSLTGKKCAVLAPESYDSSTSRLSFTDTEGEVTAASQSWLPRETNEENKLPANVEQDKLNIDKNIRQDCSELDSLQTPYFLRSTSPFGSLNADELTMTDLQRSFLGNKRKKESVWKSESDSDTDLIGTSKEQSSLGISDDLGGFLIDSQDSLKQSFPLTSKDKPSSLELNIYHCSSQSSDSTDGLQFNDSLQTPSFGPSSEVWGESESGETSIMTAKTVGLHTRKRKMKIMEPNISKEVFECNSLHTPSFLNINKKVRVVSSVNYVADRHKNIESSASQSQSGSLDLHTPAFLKELSEDSDFLDSQLF